MPRSVNHVASRAKKKENTKAHPRLLRKPSQCPDRSEEHLGEGSDLRLPRPQAEKARFPRSRIQRINAAARMEDLSYSKLMGLIHKAGIEINRKVPRRPRHEQSRGFQSHRQQGEVNFAQRIGSTLERRDNNKAISEFGYGLIIIAPY